MLEKKETMPTNEAMAINQNYMATERTELSKVRTSLALIIAGLLRNVPTFPICEPSSPCSAVLLPCIRRSPCSASVKFLPPVLPPSCFLQPPSLFTRMPPLIPGSKRNSPRLNSVSHF